jgi:cation:H+ antiporter
MVLLWSEFLLCSVVVVYAGTNLSRYGDVIAEKSGLGRAWIGLILMAGVTSLPELITGVSSVVLANAPNIAVGDVMGSCVFNLSIIAILDILHGPKPIFSRCEHSHNLSAGFGVIFIGIAIMMIVAGPAVPAAGWVGAATPLIIVLYFVGMRSVFLFQRRQLKEHAGELAAQLKYERITTRQAGFRYGANALIIIAAATWLPFIGDQLAVKTGLGQSFVGSIFIAITTSLPELVVAVAALRIGAADMAIANLFGSNMFNIIILAVDDLAYRRGPLLAMVSWNHAVTGSIAIIMSAIAMVSLTFRLERKTVLRIGWDAVALLLAYLANISLLYRLRGTG